MISFSYLTGLSGAHIGQFAHPAGWSCRVHRDLYAPIIHLCNLAEEAGFDLRVASGFRNFERQAAIWKAKAQAEKPVLGACESPLNRDDHNDWEWVQAILRWSALPGASRHHWGTDIDIFDLSSLPKGYQLQLTAEETQPNGIMGDFYEWLDECLSRPDMCDIWRRPYLPPSSTSAEPDADSFGVAAEPWHLSYQPTAQAFEQAFDAERFTKWFEKQPIPLNNIVIQHFDVIYDRFIRQYFENKS